MLHYSPANEQRLVFRKLPGWMRKVTEDRCDHKGAVSLYPVIISVVEEEWKLLRKVPVITTVRLSIQEFAHLQGVILRNLSTKQKPACIAGSAVSAADFLWPIKKGMSPTEVALRIMAPAAVYLTLTKQVERPRLVKPWRWFCNSCWGGTLEYECGAFVDMIDTKAQLSDNAHLVESGSKDASVGPDEGGSPPPGPPPAPIPKPSAPPLDPEPSSHIDASGERVGTFHKTPERGVAAQTNTNNLLGRAVVGKNYDGSKSSSIVGAMIGPAPKPPNVYSNTTNNLKDGIAERIAKAKREVNPSTEDKAKIGRFVREAMNKIFTEDAIRQWATDHSLLQDCRSSKWSDKRFHDAVQNAWGKEAFYTIKAAIKAEPMPEGKAPRILLADGDLGQLYALCIVKCFEDICFSQDNFECFSIKHKSRHEALDEVTKMIGFAIESDGKAWDTTCTALIRELVENPILAKISKILVEIGLVPHEWADAHLRVCKKPQLKLLFKDAETNETFVTVIDAIRRSGHRGTSILNYWVNFVMWHCAIYELPWLFLKKNRTQAKDVTGTKRYIRKKFEGDDALVTLYPRVTPGDKLSTAFEAFWHRCGFNLKLVYATDRAEFCGTHYVCKDGNLTTEWCPDLPRCIEGCGISTSVKAKEEALSGDLSEVAAASYLARAYDFAGILPSVSDKFLNVALSWTGKNFDDHEMSMVVGGRTGHNTHDVQSLIRQKNADNPLSMTEELAKLSRYGYPCTHEELDRWLCYDFKIEPTLATIKEYRDILPRSWLRA